MKKRLALVAHNSTNPHFEIKAMDENGQQATILSGADLGQVLNHAACILGHTLVIPLSGPETSF